MAYLEQVFIEGSTGAVLDSAAGTPNAHALTIQGNSSGVAVPVSGTVVAEIEGHAGATLDGAAGSPSTQCLTIQGNSSGTAVPVTGTFYPTTQPVEITGHAGATLDGTAGSPSTGVLTIQGVGSGTAVPVSGTFYQATQPVSGTVTAEIEGHGGATLDAAPGAAIPTNAVMVGGSDGTELRAIATDTGGQVKVLIENASAIPVSLSGNQAVNIAQVAGATPSKTNGLFVVPGDNANSITMKAASTASVAADTSLVVQINPEQPNLTTALNVSDASSVAQGSTTSGQVGPLNQIATVTSAPTYTNAKTNPMTGDAAGCLRINPAGQTGSFTTAVYPATAVVNADSTTILTVPAGVKWRLKSLQITYVSSGTADTRQLQLFINDASSHPLFAGVPANTQLAGVTYRYVFGPGLPLLAQSNSTAYIPMPEFALGPGAFIQYFVSTAPTSDSIQATACIELYND